MKHREAGKSFSSLSCCSCCGCCSLPACKTGLQTCPPPRQLRVTLYSHSQTESVCIDPLHVRLDVTHWVSTEHAQNIIDLGHDGRNPAILDSVMEQRQFLDIVLHCKRCLSNARRDRIPALNVQIGCSLGKHNSVAVCELLKVYSKN